MGLASPGRGLIFQGMKTAITTLALAMAVSTSLSHPAAATDGIALDQGVFVTGAAPDLSSLRWTHRPVIVFADSTADPRFVRQMEFLNTRVSELEEREVIVITDTDPGTLSPLREKLRPRGFMLVLIGKDGQVKLRKPAPWDVRELSRTIDKMPMRQQEIRDRQ